MQNKVKLVLVALSLIFGSNAVAAEKPAAAAVQKKESRFVRARNYASSLKGGLLYQSYNVTSTYAGKASAFAKSCVPSFVGASAALYAYNNVDLSSAKIGLTSVRDYAAGSRFGNFVTTTGSRIAGNSYVKTMNANRGTTALFTAAGLVLAKLAYDKCSASFTKAKIVVTAAHRFGVEHCKAPKAAVLTSKYPIEVEIIPAKKAIRS